MPIRRIREHVAAFNWSAAAVDIAIVGRPNTGKSTFVNRVLGHERRIVSEGPGTTRDPIDTAI